ncbi:MAG TPA: hypothetical protein PKI19_12620, partial [Elusimicrobiales bacterium]|nr:hypothetical protein [Elusimicrobiales bacterium]
KPAQENGYQAAYGGDSGPDQEQEDAAAAEAKKVVTIKPVPEAPVVPAPKPKAPAIMLVDQNQFFQKPAAYAGRELEMSLQMITAKKQTNGWRLNLVHTGPKKKLNYLYVDDQDTLGEKPDLRIGYFYRVVFRCQKGDPADGNVLSSINFTGQKAEWATGLSAIE